MTTASTRSASRAQTIAAYPVLTSHSIAHPVWVHKTKHFHASYRNALALTISSTWQITQIANPVQYPASVVSQMPATV